jgi:Putative RNA methylase family UPF0020
MEHDIDVDQYVALVPQGIEHVVAEMVRGQLSSSQFQVTVTLLGETDDVVSTLPQYSFPQHPLCARSVGTVELPSHQHVSVGYASAASSNVWTVTGQLEGTVWIEISTDAPVNVVAELRCLGPILGLVQCYNDLTAATSLEETSLRIQQRIVHDPSYRIRFEAALRLWRRHVQNIWPNIPLEHSRDASILRYRVSCLRNYSKRYPYTRRELLGMVGDCVIPTCQEPSWTVELTNYDLEIVLFQRPDCLLIGFALRPYQLLHTRSFASGELPPDVTSPFAPSSLRMVRLRSTTAQVLLHLAQLQTGDVVLDPCVGVGTIPLEAGHLPNHHAVVSLGGDLVLNDPAFLAMAVKYRAACVSSSGAPVADCMAWDATHLPIRSESIDAIVTDLPFGQLCLSAKKLDAFLPLLLAEMARVVRRETGRLVLLCGSYAPILKGLQYANERLLLDSCTLIWEIPCQAVFPVNIGGNLAWIIQVHRGRGALAPVLGQRERIRKLVHKREHTEKMMQGSQDKTKHPQS